MTSSVTRFAVIGCLFFAATISTPAFTGTRYSAPPEVDSVPAAPGKPGVVRVHADSSLISLEKSLRGKTEMRGYRIQIFLGSLQEAKTVRQKFLALGLGQAAYLVQNVPDQTVQVGDFRYLIQAHDFLREVKVHYPGAFVIATRIEPPKLIKPKI